MLPSELFALLFDALLFVTFVLFDALLEPLFTVLLALLFVSLFVLGTVVLFSSDISLLFGSSETLFCSSIVSLSIVEFTSVVASASVLPLK